MMKIRMVVMPGNNNTYLEVVSSAVVPASGIATCAVAPPVGQYWFPTFVKISNLITPAQKLLGTYPYCALFSGMPALQDNSTFIDDTIYGYGDTSSILSGSIIQYGQAISASWMGAIPGTTVYLTVYGVTSSVPLSEADLFPSSPGTHFAGHGLVTTNNVAITTLNTPVLTSGNFATSPTVDMRIYNGFFITVTINTNGVPTKFNVSQIELWWQDGVNNTVYRHTYQIFNNQTTVFVCPNGTINIQDTCHGSNLFVRVQNTGVDPASVNIAIYGTSRNYGKPYVEELSTASNSSDGITLDTVATALAGGTSLVVPGKIGPGRMYARLSSGTQATAFTLIYGNQANPGVTWTVNANATTLVEFVAPNRSPLWTITNNGASASSPELQTYRQDIPV